MNYKFNLNGWWKERQTEANEDITPGVYRYQLSGAISTSGKLVIIR
jgi:hypothetical protein